MVGALASLLATRAIIAFAWRLKILDWPDGWRKLHPAPVPRLGGLGIMAAVIVPISFLLFFPKMSAVSLVLEREIATVTSLLALSALSTALGAVDDIVGLRAKVKLAAQIGIGMLAYLAGFQIQAVNTLFGGVWNLGVFSMPITILWFVGCMNAVNLLDGLDGLAAGAVLFVCLTLILVSMHFFNVLAMLLLASVSGAILGFLVFNFPPARVFLGDSGSLLLGTLVAILSLVGTSRKAETAVGLLIPLVALGLPIFDTGLAILRRWYKKLPIAEPDRRHIHHVLVAMGYTQRRTVLLLYGVSVLLCIAALIITLGRNEATIIIIGSLIIVAIVATRVFTGLSFRDIVNRIHSANSEREAARTARHVVSRVIRQLGSVVSDQDAWKFCCEAFAALNVLNAKLVVRRGSNVVNFSWERDETGGSAKAKMTGDTCSIRLGMSASHGESGHIEIVKALVVPMPASDILTLLKELRDALVEREQSLAGRFGQDGARG